jgi:hypothetical protein
MFCLRFIVSAALFKHLNGFVAIGMPLVFDIVTLQGSRFIINVLYFGTNQITVLVVKC